MGTGGLAALFKRRGRRMNLTSPGGRGELAQRGYAHSDIDVGTFSVAAQWPIREHRFLMYRDAAVLADVATRFLQRTIPAVDALLKNPSAKVKVSA